MGAVSISETMAGQPAIARELLGLGLLQRGRRGERGLHEPPQDCTAGHVHGAAKEPRPVIREFGEQERREDYREADCDHAPVAIQPAHPSGELIEALGAVLHPSSLLEILDAVVSELARSVG